MVAGGGGRETDSRAQPPRRRGWGCPSQGSTGFSSGAGTTSVAQGTCLLARLRRAGGQCLGDRPLRCRCRPRGLDRSSGVKPLMQPPRVRPGQTVAIVSPSSGAVGKWPHRVARATAYLNSLGLRVRVMSNAARSDGWASAPPRARVADVHEAFADNEVAVLLASIGGNHSNQLLPFLDYELIRTHPKIFQGYSDITVLHWAIRKHAGLSTFYGPALVPELGEFPTVLPTPTGSCARRGSASRRSSSSRLTCGPTSTWSGLRSPTQNDRVSCARATAG